MRIALSVEANDPQFAIGPASAWGSIGLEDSYAKVDFLIVSSIAFTLKARNRDATHALLLLLARTIVYAIYNQRVVTSHNT
jgi:hypothetical protein